MTMMQGSLSGFAFRDSSPGDRNIFAISVMNAPSHECGTDFFAGTKD
jgi:hypothetical protein